MRLPSRRRGLDAARLFADRDLRRFIDRLEARLGEAVEWAPGPVARASTQTLSAGGKRLRPVLVYLGAPKGARSGDRLVPAAAAVELVHMATLVHDDVLDRAALRRGRPTVWSTDGRELAACTGDYLFSRAFAVLAEAGDADAVALLAQCAVDLSQGEQLQILQSRRPDTTPEQYLERCSLKTGALFSTACGLGARLGGAPEPAVAALVDFGQALGLAFQIADDVLDCAGDSESTGKALGTDLIDGTATLPLLYAAQEDAEVAVALRDGPPRDGVLELLARVAATGAIGRAREAAYDFQRQAEAALDRLTDDFDTRALRAVTRGVVDREA